MSSRPLSILIVSPERDTLRRLSKFLEAFGYCVRQAGDSQQALAAAQAGRPDFLILDASTDAPVDLQLCRQTRRLWREEHIFALLLAASPEVADVTTALEAGFDDFLAVPIVFGELLARLRAGARVVEFERRLAEQTGLDQVTGLPDQASLAAEYQNRSSAECGSSLAVLDFDYFSRVADGFGRASAESVLRQAAQLVNARAIAPMMAASLGGNRLAVLVPGELDSAAPWAEATLAAIAEQEFEVGGQTLRLTASCGLSRAAPGESLDVVMTRTQKALELAKASGRNVVATSDEVDRDAAAWAAFAADGQLFQTTLARDVMQPSPLLFHQDEPVEQALALLERTSLACAPVVDNDGRLAGIVSLEQLAAVARSKGKGRGGSSVRLVRHVMTADVARFDESTPLAQLLEFFTGESAPLAIIVRDRRPRGSVHCQGLAALNEKLAAGHFSRLKPRTSTSADLLVPELAVAE